MAELPSSLPSSLSGYKEAIKGLRSFATGFSAADGYDLRSYHKVSDISPARRRRIREYWRTARQGLSQSRTPVKSRSKDRLKAIQEYSGIKYQKGFKVAFIEKRPDQKVKFGKKNKKIVVKALQSEITGISERNIMFGDEGKRQFAVNPREYITELLNNEMNKHDFGIVINGEYTIKGKPGNRGGMIKIVLDYADRYENHDDWLDGIKITSGPQPGEAREFVRQRSRLYNKTAPVREELVEVDRKIQEAQKRYRKTKNKRTKKAIARLAQLKIDLIMKLRKLNQ